MKASTAAASVGVAWPSPVTKLVALGIHRHLHRSRSEAVDRHHIIGEIRRTAPEGRALGEMAFERETGELDSSST